MYNIFSKTHNSLDKRWRKDLQIGGLSSITEYKWKADGKPTHNRLPITSKVTAGTGRQISFFL